MKTWTWTWYCLVCFQLVGTVFFAFAVEFPARRATGPGVQTSAPSNGDHAPLKYHGYCYFSQGFNDEQQSQLKDNTRIVKEREGEITKIVESIHSLTDIFKDLAMLVVDQGTVLDRIDYNIEMTVQNVEKGERGQLRLLIAPRRFVHDGKVAHHNRREGRVVFERSYC